MSSLLVYMELQNGNTREEEDLLDESDHALASFLHGYIHEGSQELMHMCVYIPLALCSHQHDHFQSDFESPQDDDHKSDELSGLAGDVAVGAGLWASEAAV